jgi:hypothetical protein
MSYCESALNGSFRQMLDSNLRMLEEIYGRDKPMIERQRVSNRLDLQYSLLHWYDFGCLRQIRDWLRLKSAPGNRVPSISLIASSEADWRKHSGQVVSSVWKEQLDTALVYLPLGEELDRLALMSKALGFEPSSSKA